MSIQQAYIRHLASQILECLSIGLYGSLRDAPLNSAVLNSENNRSSRQLATAGIDGVTDQSLGVLLSYMISHAAV